MTLHTFARHKHDDFLLQGVTEFVEATVKRMLPGDYCQRQKTHEDEMNELLGKQIT